MKRYAAAQAWSPGTIDTAWDAVLAGARVGTGGDFGLKKLLKNPPRDFAAIASLARSAREYPRATVN